MPDQRYRHKRSDMVAHGEADARLWRKPTAELNRSILFGLDEGSKRLLVNAKSCEMIVRRLVERARQNIGACHCERRSLAGEQGRAIRRVPDQNDAIARPAPHADLADRIEVNL